MPPIVVIGGSAGGVAVLRTILSTLKADFPACICAVLHIGGYPSELARLIGQMSALSVGFAAQGAPLVPGRVYIAPPDHHVVVSATEVLLTRGPRENFSRPAIDPLFRSAATAFGAGAIGVVLSGRLNDGTPGLFAIKSAGGIAVVEDPGTAEFPDMPLSALQNVEVDHAVEGQRIAALLEVLVQKQLGKVAHEEEHTMIAAAANSDPVALTCPECGGAMRSELIGPLMQYVCHIGHRMTLETMAEAQLANLRDVGQTALRQLNELAETCRVMIERATSAQTRQRWQGVADRALVQGATLRKMFDEENDPPPLEG